MLRIHVASADLARTRVARAPDPLWELVLSLHQLPARGGIWAFDEWRRATMARLRAHDSVRCLAMLLPLSPARGNFPDFLTPAEAADGFEAGLAAIRATPVAKLREDLTTAHRQPSWMRRLAAGDPRLLDDLVDALRAYHRAAIEPHWPWIHNAIDTARGRHARSLLDGGYEQLFAGLRPSVRWRPPFVEADYPVPHELRLEGRGLVLIPSFFCWGKPVSLKDASLPPVLVYPVEPEARRVAAGEENRPVGQSLAQLLGRTRAAVLEAIATGCTTGELARRVGVSLASASQHATVLRQAGLITSLRRGNTVLHTHTPIAGVLLRRGR